MNYLLGDVAQQIYEYGSALKSQKLDSIIAATLASILLLDSNNHGKEKKQDLLISKKLFFSSF